jgi:hypothetical protein
VVVDSSVDVRRRRRRCCVAEGGVAGLFKQTCVSAELRWKLGRKRAKLLGASRDVEQVRGRDTHKMSKNDSRKKDRY